MGIKDDFCKAYKESCPCLHQRKTFRSFTRKVLALLIFLAIPIQSTGMFTSHWVYNETCSDIGLVYSRCENATVSGSEALHSAAYEMQLASYIILLATAVGFIGICCRFCKPSGRENNEDDSGIVKFCFPFFLPICTFFSGLFNFISCMLVRKLVLDRHYGYGYSYYLCVTTAGIVSVVSLIFITGYCFHAYGNRCKK